MPGDQELFTNPPLIPSYLQSHSQLYTHSNNLSYNQSSTAHSPSESYHISPHNQDNSQHYNHSQNSPSNQPSILSQQPNALSNRSFITYTNLTSTNLGSRSKPQNIFSFDEGPISLPFSHIPPLKESLASNSGGNNGLSFTNSNISSIFGSSSHSQHRNSLTHGAALNLQFISSPTRKLRWVEFYKKNQEFVKITPSIYLLSMP